MSTSTRPLGLVKRAPAQSPSIPSRSLKENGNSQSSSLRHSRARTGMPSEEDPSNSSSGRSPSLTSKEHKFSRFDSRSKNDSLPSAIMRGVTVKWLSDFTNKHKCWGMPTHQVVEDIVKPMTLERRCRVVDLPGVKATGAVGEAKVFVSHAWGANWGSLVAACNHGTQQSTRVWIDVLAISQHAGDEQANDLQELDVTVHLSSALLLVVALPSGSLTHGGWITDELRHQIPFARIWCLLEIYSAHKTQTPIVMKVGHVKNTMHHTWHPEENWATVKALLDLVNVQEASSKFEEDRVRILREVKNIARTFNRADSIIRGAIIGAAWGSWLPEVQAAAMGDIKLLQSVYRKYPDLEKKGVTPLISSAAGGHLPVVKELLRMGAAVNKVASHVTPLWVTAQGGHEKVLIELLRSGADVSMRDPEGRSPLLIAAEGGHLGVVKLLLGQNADILDVDMKGRTAAFLAAEHGHTEVLQALLELGSPMGTRAKDGRTLLMAASQEGHFHVVTNIIDYYNQSTLSTADFKGRNAAFLAASRGHHAVLKELLKAGVDAIKPDANNVTPLAAAAEYGDLKTVQVLIQHGGRALYQTNHDLQLMLAAIKGGNPDVVQSCMDAGCGPGTRSGLRKLAATAAILGHQDVLHVVLPFFKGSVTFADQALSVEGAQTIAKVLEVHTGTNDRESIKALDLSGCGLQRSGTLAIARTLAAHETGNGVILSTLLLDLNNIGPKGSAIIVDAMLGAKNQTLTNLRLSRNDIGEKGAKHVAKLLHPGASALQILDLWWNDLGSAGVEQICQPLIPAFKGDCSALTTLCLENNCVDDIGAEALARVLRPRKDGNTSRLTHLDLTSNEISAQGAQELARALQSTYGSEDDSHTKRGNRNLKILLLPDNEIGAKGAAALAQATMHEGSALHTLDIAENKIGPKGALAVAESLKGGSSITDINVSGNYIGCKGLQALATCLLPQHGLKCLNVSRNGITSQDMAELSLSNDDDSSADPSSFQTSMHMHPSRQTRSGQQTFQSSRRTIILAGNRCTSKEVEDALSGIAGLSAHL